MTEAMQAAAAGGAKGREPRGGQGALIAFRWDRLGARLISIVNTLRIAEDHGLPFRICWPIASGTGAELNAPEELFDAGFVARHFEDYVALGERRRTAVPLARTGDRPGDLARVLGSGRDVAVEMIFGIAALPGEDPATVTRRCGEVFRALPFAPALRPLMAGLGAGLAGATACHIRRGDTIRVPRAMNKAWPTKYVPEEFFRPHIAAALGAGRPVLLFSDDAGLVARLQGEFPGLKAAADVVPAEGLSPAQRDLLELYAMSLCERIVAPEGSAFSSTAATLGGRSLSDVKATLPAAARKAAHEALFERLRARPDSFDGPGDIGQCVPHLSAHLLAEGRGAEAAAAFGALVRGGLDISFVAAEAMTLTLAHGRPDEVLALAEALARTPPRMERDFVRCRLVEAAARASLGDARGALRALLNAFGHDPAHPDFRLAIPLLAGAGGLPGAEFLPNAPELFALSGRRLAAPGPGTPAHHLCALLPAGAALPDRGLPEPFWFDWEPLLGARLIEASLTKGPGGGFERALEQAARRPAPSAAVLSMQALLQAHHGAHAPALEVLARLAAEAPGDALVLHRLGRARLMARQPLRAVKAAGAAARADGSPAYLAWAGHLASRQRDTAEAGTEMLRAAVAADTGLPSLPLLLATAERRLGRTGAALAALDEALRIAPNNTTAMLTRARILQEAGDVAGVRAALAPAMEIDRAGAQMYQLLAEVEVAAGRPAAARAAVEEGLLRKPDHPPLLALKADLG